MGEGFIEIESYEGGRWITRRYPRSVAVSLLQQLQVALDEHGPAQQVLHSEDRLKIHVE